jgi:hypothetical protein
LKLDWPGRASWSGSCFSGEPSSRRRVVVTPRPETGAAEEGGLIPHSEQTLSAESHRPSPLAALPLYQALHQLVSSAERTLPSGMALLRIVVSAREKTWQGLKEVMYQCVGSPAENYTLVARPVIGCLLIGSSLMSQESARRSGKTQVATPRVVSFRIGR